MCPLMGWTDHLYHFLKISNDNCYVQYKALSAMYKALF